MHFVKSSSKVQLFMKLSFFVMFFTVWCQISAQPGTQAFGDYWYSGQAEITSYELTQWRYGETRKGHAVTIFVTEPFSRKEQVKIDQPTGNSDEVTVLKLNLVKKFVTGIYPYSMMMSSFVPVSFDQYPDAIKVTSSSQEWCGHTFTQLNLEGNEYRFREYSYFQSEGDRDLKLANVWLEDELWQRIRLDPKSLPKGPIRILPGTLYGRLAHNSGKISTATASTSYSETQNASGENVMAGSFELKYDDRTLTIYFDGQFPHQITGWDETYQGQTTSARMIKSIKSPYWQQHDLDDEYLREALGIN